MKRRREELAREGEGADVGPLQVQAGVAAQRVVLRVRVERRAVQRVEEDDARRPPALLEHEAPPVVAAEPYIAAEPTVAVV